MRLAVLGLFHEANTFSPVVADRTMFADGGVLRGEAIVNEYKGSSATIGGLLAGADKLGVDAVPLMFAFVNPTGPITEDAFEDLAGEMLDELSTRGPWDGVMLNIHGAAVAEHLMDADGELAARVRRVVGPDVPVGAVLDLHANASQELIDALTVTLAYQTNPHVDAAQQAMRCTELVVQTARREIRPCQYLVRLPLTVNVARQDTAVPPMSTLMAAAAALRGTRGMLSVSLIQGFPYADVPHMGMSCLAVHDGDQAEARAAAESLASVVWASREDLQARGLTVDEALDIVERDPKGPVVMLDVGDNIGGGAPGDSTLILTAARKRGLGPVVQTLYDPGSAGQCVESGAGSRVDLQVGGRHSATPPLSLSGRISRITDGRFEDPSPTHGGFRYFDMGTTAVVETDDGHALLLTSRLIMNTSLQQLLSHGIEPRDFRIVVAKGVNGPRAAYTPIARQLLVVDTAGVTTMTVEHLPYNHRHHPIYPFEPATPTPIFTTA